MYNVRYKGVDWYFSPKIKDTPGCESTITANVAGIIRREAILMEYLKTVLIVSCSFWALIFENAGNRMVVTGVTKNPTRTVKLNAKL